MKHKLCLSVHLKLSVFFSVLFTVICQPVFLRHCDLLKLTVVGWITSQSAFRPVTSVHQTAELMHQNDKLCIGGATGYAGYAGAYTHVKYYFHVFHKVSLPHSYVFSYDAVES